MSGINNDCHCTDVLSIYSLWPQCILFAVVHSVHSASYSLWSYSGCVCMGCWFTRLWAVYSFCHTETCFSRLLVPPGWCAYFFLICFGKSLNLCSIGEVGAYDSSLTLPLAPSLKIRAGSVELINDQVDK